MNPRRTLKKLIDQLRAKHHLRVGATAFRRGKLETAAERVERAVSTGGASFDAHLLLGRIYLRIGRFDRARQEFAHARHLDPGRFAADGLPEDLLLELAERRYASPWAILGPREERALCAEPPLDDFSSNDERDRFRDLPPIDRDDIESLDWQDLSDQLFDH